MISGGRRCGNDYSAYRRILCQIPLAKAPNAQTRTDAKALKVYVIAPGRYRCFWMPASKSEPFCLELCCERGGDWLTEARGG